ncbi:flagellin, partial [Hathewaya histolytica]|uniref:flagellin n=1 Tax=Hathewaya histolytica TaxID=1498 RepID=UPI003B6737E7
QLQQEVNQLTSEINRVGNTTEFNTQKLLNGNKAGDAVKEEKFTADQLGEFKLTVDKTAGNEVTIEGKTFKFDVTTDDEAKMAAKFTADAELSAKYTITGTAGSITVKQKTATTQATLNASGSGVTKNEVTTAGEKKDDIKTPGKEGRVKLQVGANEHQSMSIEIGDMRSKALGISGDADAAATDGAKFTKTSAVTDGTNDATTEAGLDLSSHANATAAIKVLDSAINTVSTQRSKLGAYQNRLEHTINNLNTSSENLQASESRIRDVDMA